jgi:hypothetical protein
MLSGSSTCAFSEIRKFVPFLAVRVKAPRDEVFRDAEDGPDLSWMFHRGMKMQAVR